VWLERETGERTGRALLSNIFEVKSGKGIPLLIRKNGGGGGERDGGRAMDGCSPIPRKRKASSSVENSGRKRESRGVTRGKGGGARERGQPPVVLLGGPKKVSGPALQGEGGRRGTKNDVGCRRLIKKKKRMSITERKGRGGGTSNREKKGTGHGRTRRAASEKREW